MTVLNNNTRMEQFLFDGQTSHPIYTKDLNLSYRVGGFILSNSYI